MDLPWLGARWRAAIGWAFVLAAGTLAAFLVLSGSLGTGEAQVPPESIWPTPTNADRDADGCSDWEELGETPSLGGYREIDIFWDVFDTPSAGNLRDQSITIADIQRVVARFGSANPLWFTIDPLSPPPPAPAYHTAYDRVPGLPGAAWSSGPPNGSVTVGDIIAVVTQFGHSCVSGDPLPAAFFDVAEMSDYYEDVLAPALRPLTTPSGGSSALLAPPELPPELTLVCSDPTTGIVAFELSVPGTAQDTGDLTITPTGEPLSVPTTEPPATPPAKEDYHVPPC